jgi:hypothetical protein
MTKKASKFIEMFRRARDFDTDRFYQYQENLAFYEGQQHLLDRYLTEKPWVVDINSPYATDAINNRVSSLMANEYIGQLEPLSPDDAEIVTTLNDAYVNQWNEMNIDNLINEAILKSAINREAYVHIIYDPNSVTGGTNRLREGKLEAYFIDTESMLIDPNARSFKDADYVIVAERISPNKADLLYKYKRDTGNDNNYGSMFTPEDRGEMSIDVDFTSEQQEALTKLTFYEKTKKGIVKTVLIEDKIVEKSKVIPIKNYPIAQLRWEKKQKSPYGISLMDRLLPLQKSVNSIESAITNTALSFAAPSFVVRRDSGVDPQAVASVAGAPGVVFSVNGDPNNAIRPLINNAIDNQMILVKRENEQTIYKLAGVNAQFQGDIGTAGNTAGGASEAVRRAKIIEQQFLNNLEEFVEDLTRIVVEYIVNVFQGETLYTRSERQANGTFEFGQIDMPDQDMTDLEYTFYVNLDVKTPFSRDKSKALIQELFQIERQYDAPVKTINIQDIINTYDLPNKQELIKRYEYLAGKEDEGTAQIITQFVANALQAQVDVQTITQGILELLAKKETPTVDAVLQQMEQQIAQQEQQAMMQQRQQEQMANTPQEGEEQLGQLIQQVEAALAQGTPMDQIMAQLQQAGVPNQVIQGIMQELQIQ